MISEILNTKWYTIIDKKKKSSTTSTTELNYLPGYHEFKKPQIEKVKQKITVWDIIDKLCGIYLYFYSMNKLSNKLVNKNNYTWHKTQK